MEEDIESSDISAAELAAISNKGQYARSISLALSANADEFAPVTTSSEHDDWCQSGVSRASGSGTCATFGRKTDADVGSPYDSTTEESSSASDEDSETVKETPLLTSAASHRRRRTRLQRRRLRQVQRGFLASFMIHRNFDEDMQVQGADRPRQVPSLMELCMQTGISKTGPLAPGLRPLLSHHRAKTKLAAQQLRWLGHNLGLLEKQIKWDIVEVRDPCGVKRTYLKRDARSLWRVDWRTERRLHPSETQWILPVYGQTHSSVDWKIAAIAHYIDLMLPHQYADDSFRITHSLGEHNIEKIKRHLRKRHPNLVQHCFDHALAYVWWARGQCTRAQEAFMKVAQRYPADRHMETDKPSTLWARHRAMVLAEIGRMLTTFDRPDTAGQFYREAVEEAARELQPDEASKLTLQSQALTASAYDQGTMDQHSAIQAASLWSVAVEQARLVREIQRPEYRGQRSHWTSVHDMSEEKGGCEVVLAAVESLVHCHAGYPTQDSADRNVPNSSQRNQVWLTEVRARLEKLLNPQCAFVGLYLSFILAMLGEGDLAKDAFRVSLTSMDPETPNRIVSLVPKDDNMSHPWWLFLKWIEARASVLGRGTTREPLRVLPLVWRRGLGRTSYCFNRNDSFTRGQVADIQGMTPDLHVTPQGHLCGTMIQNLPPLRKVYIDARSGAIHFDDSGCEELHHWDNYTTCTCADEKRGAAPPTFRFGCNSMPPCLNIIYSDPETSTRVSLMTAGITTYYRSLAYKKAFRWDPRWDQVTDDELQKLKEDYKMLNRQEVRSTMSAVFQSSGNSVKVDIIELFMQDRKKRLLGELIKLNEYDTASMKLAEEFIDYCIKLRYEVSVQTVQSFLYERKEAQKGSAHGQRCRQRTSKNAHFVKFFDEFGSWQGFAPQVVDILLQNILYVGKTTVVLVLHAHGYDALVFLDCSSPSSFRQPVIKGTPYSKRWVVPKGVFCWSTPNPAVNFMFAFVNYSTWPELVGHEKMHLFDEKGNILCYRKPIDEEEPGCEISRCYTTCYGQTLIGVHTISSTLARKTKASVYDIQTGTERLSAELPVIRMLAVVQDTLYALTQEGLYALDPITLEPLAIHQLVKPSLSRLAPSDPGRLMHLEAWKDFKVLGQCEVMVTDDKAVTYNRAFLGLENHLLLLQRRKFGEGQLLEGEEVPNVLEVLDIMLPGQPKEFCYIGEKAGFVVSATIFRYDTFNPYYGENLYWFDTSGDMIAIHPFIGKGPHGFLPVYLRDEATKDDGKAENKDNLYLYFADGLGALCCARLDKSEY